MKWIALLFLFFQVPGFGQTTGPAGQFNTLTSSRNAFIKNAGQYGQTVAGHTAMGSVKYGFEGFDMRVLFTPKGLIHLHRKMERPSESEEKILKPKGIPEEEIERKVRVTDKMITMEWVGADPNPSIIADGVTKDYHTYGLLKEKAFGYKKIIYKDLYPGIDIVYHLTNNGKTGFEYSIVVKPGADLRLVKMKYGGEIKKIMINREGSLLISSGINDIIETSPLGFSNTGAELMLTASEDKQQHLYHVSFQQQNNIISFNAAGYDKTKTLVIDPFVGNTNNLTGSNSGVAKDIDFDYEGNIYVAGGGDAFIACQLAKFNAAGVLQWTFNGSLTTPTWNFGVYYGGWVVEKSTGNVFLGQGLRQTGTQVIRLSTAGVYDNYITAADNRFWENWKMLWSCNSGNPQILIAGGGITSNINLAICSPPSTTLAASNITGVATFAQDIADIVIDPLTNDMYTIYASEILSPDMNNRIYKNRPPYNSSNIAWNTLSGFSTLMEAGNRPYMTSGSGSNTENSINSLAVNSSYLFYWDGLNLKAFNKTDGTAAGMALALSPNTALMQGGIIADECNNVFIGNTNGTIKVYHFDGLGFNDAPADISIPGFPGAAVYDLAYDPARLLLYACGNGFVGSFDISSYCVNTVYTILIAKDCPSLSIQASLNPLPPGGTAITYALFTGTTQIATNSTGLFTGLSMGTNYTIKVFLDPACGGIQLIDHFTMDDCVPSVSATFINPSCNLQNGSIHAVAVNGVPPYQFSKDGITFQASGIFTGLAAGNYTITVKDALNSIATINVTLVNSLPLQVTAVSVASSCDQYSGVITATGAGGAAPLKYSMDGILFQPSGIFTGLAPGNHTVTVKDTNACIASVPVFVDSLNTVVANAGNNIIICEGAKQTLAATSNGTSFSWSPATGLSNPNILAPDASPLVTTIYTLTAGIGICKATGVVTVFVNPAPVANAGRDTGICFGKDVQLNGSGGISYQWSPSTYLSATAVPDPVVQQPAAGSITYHLLVTDTNGCPSLKDDAVTVTVSQPAKLFAGADTSIAINQPLPLHGIDVNNTGFINYTWSPVYGLNDPFSADPVAILDRDIVFTVIASNAYGCTATDDIKIKVYEGPEIYVPNAFTPNDDGLNDILKAIVIGMKEFHYFSIFNSYGQMVFTTADASKGWDGYFKGVKQLMGTYVWMAEAIDYRGNKIQRKGSVILIR